MKISLITLFAVLMASLLFIGCSETKVPVAMHHFKRGNQQFKGHSYGIAINEYKTAISIDPTQAVFHYNLGLTYYTIQQFEFAINAYQKAIDLNPKLTESWYNLSLALYHFGKTDEAAVAHETYLKLVRNPNKPLK